MQTLLQGIFVEAEGAGSLLVSAMPVSSWLGRGVMRSPGSQDRGKEAPRPSSTSRRPFG